MSRTTTDPFPVARTEGLIVEEIGAETVVFDEDSKQAHHLSPLASVVFARSDGRTSISELAQFARSRLDEPVDERGVEAALAQLKESHLLAAAPRQISRRSMLRRTGAAAGAAFATPVITSIMTPAFAQGTPPGPVCPGAICSSQSQGDDFCACANNCPEDVPPRQDDRDKCAKTGPPIGPYRDSCECLDCGQLRDAGRPDLCPPMPHQQCPPDSSPENPGPGGCTDPNKFLDGACLRMGGDSSEACPEPSLTGL
jgi:hypothetical protein